MLKKLLPGVLLIAALLAGCQPGNAPAPTLVPTISISTPTPVTPDGSYAPSTTDAAPQPADNTGELPGAYPAGVTPAPLPGPDTSSAYPAYPAQSGDYWTSYPPAPGDESLERGNFLLDALTAQVDPSAPGSVDLYVEGALPTPCHQPRVTVSKPDTRNVITLDLYTLISTETICAQVTQPYNEKIATLNGLAPGSYSVVMEGNTVTEFVVP